MSKKIEQKVAKVIYLALLTLALLVFVSPFFIPIIFASSVALTLFPLLLKLEHLNIKRKRAAGILTVLFTILISIPIAFFITKGTILITAQLENINFNEQLRDQGMQGFVSDMRHEIVNFIYKHASKINAEEFLTPKKIDGYLNTMTTFLLKFFSGLASSLPVAFLLLLVTILCTYSFLKYASSIRKFFQELFGLSDEVMVHLVQVSIRNARSVYVSNVATGCIQSLIVAITATIFGVGSFFLIFFITLILSFIPVIGAAPVAFLCALYLYLKGETTQAIIFLAVGGFTGVVDNILRPWLSSIGESTMPPIVAFVCVLGGALLLGFPGLFIGLLVGSFAYDTLPIFWKEIAKGND